MILGCVSLFKSPPPPKKSVFLHSKKETMLYFFIQHSLYAFNRLHSCRLDYIRNCLKFISLCL